MNLERKTKLVTQLVQHLVDEFDAHEFSIPVDMTSVPRDESASFDELWLAFRALVNVRPPWAASPEFLLAQNELLNALIEEAGIRTLADAESSPAEARMLLWRGDITTLAADAIVNAANSGMTGCWQPLHYCIDNAIHTYAGVQLRIHMARRMEEQGHEEPTGHAYLSPAYNLPSKHVIHTVGPIAAGSPSDLHCAQLAQCYQSCLDAAACAECLSIAFCCISTGVFGFPQREAAEIALETVASWLEARPDSSMAVVFNVFCEDDERIYRELLEL